MSRSKLDAHSAEILAALADGESQRQLAKKYGVARSTFQHWMDRQEHPEPAAVPGELDEMERLLIEAELKKLKAEERKANDVEAQAERIYREVASAVKAAPVKYKPPKLGKHKFAPQPQALLLSDTHAAEVVEPEAINGMNVFNWDVLVERMANIQKSLLSFQANRPYPIGELHLWCLGDMLSGDNHDELSKTNEYPIAEQAYKFGMLLGQWIEELIPHYPKVIVKGVVGNHPRVTKKPANKQVFNNFDWISYKIAETYLAGYIADGVIEVDFPRSGLIVANIADLNILLTHGDGIRSTMPGVPWGGVMRRWNALRSQYLEHNVKLDYMALGHFHSPAVVPHIFMNGSVKGADEYSVKQFGNAEPPCQLLLTFDQEKSRLTDVSHINP